MDDDGSRSISLDEFRKGIQGYGIILNEKVNSFYIIIHVKCVRINIIVIIISVCMAHCVSHLLLSNLMSPLTSYQTLSLV